MSEPSLVLDLVELSLLATNADAVEFVLQRESLERLAAARSGLQPGPIGLDMVDAAVVVANVAAENLGVPSGVWVASYVAVPVVGPSGEAGMLAAAHTTTAAFDDRALEIMVRTAASIENRLDRSIEQANLGELGQQLYDTQVELQATRDRLEVSNQELEQFAYIAAHELVAPLRSVAVYAEVLGSTSSDDQLSAEQRNDCVGEIRAGVQRMTQQVQYLLSLSSSQVDVNDTVPVALGDVVQAALDTLSGGLEGVSAVVRVGDLPIVQASPIPLQSVFANLLTNAIRYRSHDRGLEIDIDSVVTANGPRVVVSDNGRGVEKPQQRRIFKLFERASATEAGAGIGLAVSRRILDGFDATIGVESGTDHGSTFWIQFPRSTPSRMPHATD